MHAFITNLAPQIPESQNIFHIQPDSSIGIDEVRQIQHFLSRKATIGNNIVIIHQAHLLTLPAQNALLKTLEEPPANSQIYLQTTLPDQLLPTVLSRCQILTTTQQHEYALIDTKSLTDNSPIAQKLKFIESQEFDRQSALTFLDNLEFTLHSQIVSNNSPTIKYEAIAQARKYLKANCSIKLTMDNFVLNNNLN